MDRNLEQNRWRFPLHIPQYTIRECLVDFYCFGEGQLDDVRLLTNAGQRETRGVGQCPDTCVQEGTRTLGKTPQFLE